MEVVSGFRAFNKDGSIFYSVSTSGGYPAVANFDDDNNPEVVVVSGGKVSLLEHNGTRKWGPVSLPGGGRGGPPTVADFDGDGKPEIGVAGSSFYTVFETNGSVKWSKPTSDFSSNVTGSSVFDFDGDGRVEVIYNDEYYLRVYDGISGDVLFETLNPTCTGVEYPAIVDVDNDKRADIIVGRNQVCGIAARVGINNSGIFVFENNNWISTRRIWNQHTYHITNINEDSTVPQFESRNWLTAGLNNFRLNKFSPTDKYNKADLVSHNPSINSQLCPSTIGLNAEVGNMGEGVAKAGSKHILRLDGNTLQQFTLSRDLMPGEFENFSIISSVLKRGEQNISFLVDISSAIDELDETNNQSSLLADICPVKCADQFQVRPKGDKAQLTWAYTQDAGYEIFRAANIAGPYVSIGSTASNYATFLDEKPPIGVVSYYKLKRSPGEVGEAFCESAPVAALVPGSRSRTKLAAVPDLLGKTRTQAESTLTGAGFKTGTVATAQNTLPDGQVFEQNPPVGSMVAAGSAVAFTTSINPQPANQPPLLGNLSGAAVDEGSLFLLNGSFNDPDPDQWRAFVEFGDGTPRKEIFVPASKAMVASHLYPDNGQYTLTLSVEDNHGGTNNKTFVADIRNAAPRVALGENANLTRGLAFSREGSFSDTGTDSWTASVDYGDGSGAQPLALTVDKHFNLQHTYTTTGAFAVRVVVTDDDGGSGQAQFTANVALPTTQVPNLLNLSQADAGSRLAAANLKLGEINPIESKTVAKGLVLSQTPAAGTSVSINTAVDVGLSLGNVNEAPVITSSAPSLGVATVSFLYTVTASDPDGDSLNYSLLQAPSGMTIDATTGAIAWTPGAAQIGTANVVVKVADPDNLSAQQAFSVRIVANQPTLVPDVGGKNSSQAQTLLHNANLLLGNVSVSVNKDVAAGLIFGQSPAAGASVQAGSVVAVTVSGGTSLDTPQVGFISPESGAELRQPVAVIGNVIKASAGINANEELSWETHLARVGSSDYQIIGSGSGQLIGGRLGTIDPTLLQNDSYRVTVVYNQGSSSGSAFIEYAVVGDLKLGNFRLDFTDLNVPLAGVPITITRRYDTLDLSKGDFGAGWRLSVAGNVRDGRPNGQPFAYGTRVFVTLPDGQRVSFKFMPTVPSFLFPWIQNVVFTPDAGVYDKLEAVGQDMVMSFSGLYYAGFTDVFNPRTYKLTRPDGTVYVIDEFSGLDSITDSNGNQLVFGAAGITHSSGESIQFARDGQNRITAITDPNGNTIRYQYDAAGNLVSVTDQENQTTQFSYLQNPAHYLDEIVDSLGRRAQKTEYDSAGRVVAVIDALGNRTEQYFNQNAFAWTTTDAVGNVTELVYNERGNVLQRKDPLGGINHYAYDDPKNPDSETQVIDANGNITRFAYDARGNRVQQTDALGAVTTLAYNEFNKLTQVTDALGRVQQMNYDGKSNLTQLTNAANQVAQFAYNNAGNIIQTTDFNGNVTYFDYTDGCGCGKPSKITYADGSVRQLQYNTFGQVTRNIDPQGHSKQFEYDRVGRLVKEIDELGNAITTEYSANNPVKKTDALGRVTRMEYDDLNRLVKEIDAAGAATLRSYDALGNLLALTDPVGNTTQFVYDANNRLVEKVDPLGHSATYSYDPKGNKVGSVDRNGRKTTYAYDAKNRQVEEHWLAANGAVIRSTSMAYDAVGHLLSVADPDSRLSYSYTALDTLQQVSNAGSPNQPLLVLNYSYDGNGQLLTARDNYGVQVASEYDAKGAIVAHRWSGGGIDPAGIQYTRNARGEISEVSRFADTAGNALVNKTTVDAIDPRGLIEQMVHRDHFGGVLSGADYRYQYNPAAQLTSAQHHGNGTTYGYDATDQLLQANHSQLPDESYSYDPNGNRKTSYLHGSGYQTGGNNQLLSDGQYDYSYDNEGNRLSKTRRATGEVTLYDWDYRNRLVGVEKRASANGAVLSRIEYRYDANNRRIARIVDGVAEGTLYDGDNAWLDTDANGAITTRYLFGPGMDRNIARWRDSEGTVWYLTDKLGTVRDLLDSSGHIINHNDYASFGGLLAQTSQQDADRYAFTGREYDTDAGLYYYRARYYDPVVGRFIGEDPIGFEGKDSNLYRYVSNKPIGGVDPTGNRALSEYTFLIKHLTDTLLGVEKLGAVVMAKDAFIAASQSLQVIHRIYVAQGAGAALASTEAAFLRDFFSSISTSGSAQAPMVIRILTVGIRDLSIKIGGMQFTNTVIDVLFQ
nr:PASTA domain-containing protein [Methylomonas koyamae]